MGVLGRLAEGLKKTRAALGQRLEGVLSSALTEEALEELEEVLIGADMGVEAALELTQALRQARPRDTEEAREFLKAQALRLLGRGQPLVVFGQRPFVLMVVGVNGTGKTTTIGKLAHRWVSEGHSVLLAAADTFRAAAAEQLELWARRAGAQVVKQRPGADPAAVAFDAVKAAQARGIEVVIVDTAGRLHTKAPLMEELKKVKRVLGKAHPEAPQEVLLVLDATTGQNALRQARMFHQAVAVTGIALAKLDGSSKGGMVLAIRKELGLAVRLVGLGEGLEDLRDFDPQEFVEGIFG